ncbi:hypothetical protein BDV59DRAFT_181101 [Aspergillus ambiguus]|uniref:uncharacterized protein n=1 Tax=Aspergillus ambiguus TaxID=176160 RepID=UPI003CCD48BA
MLTLISIHWYWHCVNLFISRMTDTNKCMVHHSFPEVTVCRNYSLTISHLLVITVTSLDQGPNISTSPPTSQLTSFSYRYILTITNDPSARPPIFDTMAKSKEPSEKYHSSHVNANPNCPPGPDMSTTEAYMSSLSNERKSPQKEGDAFNHELVAAAVAGMLELVTKKTAAKKEELLEEIRTLKAKVEKQDNIIAVWMRNLDELQTSIQQEMDRHYDRHESFLSQIANLRRQTVAEPNEPNSNSSAWGTAGGKYQDNWAYPGSERGNGGMEEDPAAW